MSILGSVRSSSGRMAKRSASAGSTSPGSSTKQVILAARASSGSAPATNSAGPVGAGGRVVASPTCRVNPGAPEGAVSSPGAPEGAVSSGPPGHESVLLWAVEDIVEAADQSVDAEGDLPQRR